MKQKSTGHRRVPSLFLRFALSALLLCVALAGRSEPIPTGSGQRTLDVAGTAIELYTYKPANYAGGPLLLSLHGTNRNADGYRDYTKPLADRFGLLIVAPKFDSGRFPVWRYQNGGIARASGKADTKAVTVSPESQWTGQVFLRIIEAVSADEGRPGLPYYLIGHSAGGQTLSRFAAFVSNKAQRIVIANPSTYVWPTRDAGFPYGFGGLPERLSSDDAIRRYLAQPVILLLGTADINHDRNLVVTEGAMRQGANRYERGLNAFREARNLAQEKGWEFNWRLVEVPGVGHNARRMYASPQAEAALFSN